jgi:type II secretory ATPase GspE/PulE/Tfp pilus assembly ATPase PilB-like protein
VDSNIRETLVAGGGESKIRAMAREKGYGGLLDSGVGKIFEGLTTAEEVLRVAFTEHVKS